MTVDINVKVTDTGAMQVTVDGVTFPPLPLAAVQAMAAKVNEAVLVAASQERTAALRILGDVMVEPGSFGSLEFTADTVTAIVDDAAYARAVEAFDVQPDADGNVRSGPVVVRKRRRT